MCDLKTMSLFYLKISCARWGELHSNPLMGDSVQQPTQGFSRVLQGMEHMIVTFDLYSYVEGAGS